MYIASFILTCNAAVYDHKISAKELNKILPNLDDIDCKFKQEKVLKNINKPLISGGNFSFKKNEGIFVKGFEKILDL
jgi:hypothetical protein